MSEAIDALRRRDENAWRSFHEAEFPALFRFALGWSGNPDVAEDCASESFVRLARDLARLKVSEVTDVRRWLFVVCKNLVRDHARRRPTTPLPEEHGPAAPDSEAPLHDRLALRAALATLPDAQREVVVLRFVMGLSTQDVATRSGRHVKAVESLQHRALATLRRSLALQGYRT